MSEAVLWPLVLGVLGMVFGSFIATLAIRWPAGRSALRGRSLCDGCGRTLGAAELVPIASFLVLGGRCRNCRAPIAPAHLATEVLGAAIGVAAGWVAPGTAGVAGAAFGWLLLALGALDYAAFWLPDGLTAALAVAGLATGLAGKAPPLVDRLIAGAAGFAALWLVASGYRRWRRREGLGGGDAKLLGAIGLWLGWRALPQVVLLACLIGLAAVLAIRLGGRRLSATDRLPLGTLLGASAFVTWLAVASAG